MLKLSTTAPGKKQGFRYAWLRACFAALLLTIATANHVVAQTSMNGATPSGLAPGAPSGSFALSGFDNVNLYNGNMNFHLPLVSVGGRGGAGTVIGLPINQKWTVEQYTGGNPADPKYYPNSSWWKTTYGVPYAFSTIEGRTGGDWIGSCMYNSQGDTEPVYGRTLLRLTFRALDGTEYELRDALTGGQPQNVPRLPNGCPASRPARGKVFVTTDGTSATFISDDDLYDDDALVNTYLNETPSGYLLFRDGTRYRFDGGHLSWIRDRNGNRLTFTGSQSGTSPATTITDSLNRQIVITQSISHQTYGLCDSISYKGFGGAERTIWIAYTKLDSALRSGYSLQTYQQLFPSLYGASPYMQHNPSVVGSVWLPD